jgi:hypothetical protein
MMWGGKKHSSKKHGSKKHGSKRHQKREMPQWMADMMEVKKAVKAKHSDIKDGPALTKVVIEHIKSNGGVKGAIDALKEMSSSALSSKLEKVNAAIAAKRAAKRSSRA